MKYKLKILDDFDKDIQEGYDWYEKRLSGLGEDLLLEIDENLNYINQNPLYFQIKQKHRFREVVLKKFLYVIIYEIIKSTIIVYALFPTKDNPSKKPS